MIFDTVGIRLSETQCETGCDPESADRCWRRLFRWQDRLSRHVYGKDHGPAQLKTGRSATPAQGTWNFYFPGLVS